MIIFDYEDFPDFVADNWVILDGRALDQGVSVDAVTEYISELQPPSMVARSDSELLPLLLDHDGNLHPLFKDQKIPKFAKEPLNRLLIKERLTKKAYEECGKSAVVSVFDRSIDEIVTNLIYGYGEDGKSIWGIYGGMKLLKSKVPEFIQLASQIKKHDIKDFLD